MPAVVKSRYREPWTREGESKGVYGRGGGVAFEALGPRTADRIVATVNACAGFNHPEELAGLVEYARECASFAPCGHWCALLAKLDAPVDKEKESA